MIPALSLGAGVLVLPMLTLPIGGIIAFDLSVGPKYPSRRPLRRPRPRVVPRAHRDATTRSDPGPMEVAELERPAIREVELSERAADDLKPLPVDVQNEVYSAIWRLGLVPRPSRRLAGVGEFVGFEMLPIENTNQIAVYSFDDFVVYIERVVHREKVGLQPVEAEAAQSEPDEVERERRAAAAAARDQDLAALVRANGNTLAPCFLGEGERGAGEFVELAITIEGSGRVQSVVVEPDDGESSELESCLHDAVSRWPIEPFEGRPQILRTTLKVR